MNKILILPYQIDQSISDLDYLSEGILEELSQLISVESNLKITSRSTSFYLLNNPLPLVEIEKLYQIDFVVEGSITLKDGVFQIFTRLFRTADEELLLTERLVIEQEKWTQSLAPLANTIITTVSGEKKHLYLASKDTSKAKEFYLQGIYHWHRHSYSEMQLAIQLFKRSIKENPDYALPYAALADCYSIIGMMGYEQPIQAFKLAKEYVSKSLLLNNKRSDSYVSAALVDIYYNRELPQAKVNLEQALKLNGENLKAHHVMAMYYIHKGDFLQAEKCANVTLKLDPLAMPHYAMIIRIQVYLKKYKKALDYLNAAMNIDVQAQSLKVHRGYANLFLGNVESSIADFFDVLKMNKNDPMSMAHLSYAYSKANFYHESKELEHAIKQLDATNDTGIIPYALAIVKLGQSDIKAFFKHANQAVELGIGVFPAELKCNPIFSEVREHKDFHSIMKQCNLSDDKTSFTKERKPTSMVTLVSNTSDALSVDPQDISFIEASDNYCTIYWHESGILKRTLLRLTLKSIEQQLVEYDNILRCHKTFMVNLHQELTITGNARAYFLEGRSLPIRIPTSRAKSKSIHLLLDHFQR